MNIDKRITPEQYNALGEVKDIKKWMRRYYIRRVDEESGKGDR